MFGLKTQSARFLGGNSAFCDDGLGLLSLWFYTKRHPLNNERLAVHLVVPCVWKHEGSDLGATLKAGFLGNSFHSDDGVHDWHECFA